MDGGWRDGGEVEDEFACAGMLQGSLSSLHATVERIFRVAFCIGTQEEPSGKDGQIWLKLRGPRDAVGAAKLFVRGAVNNEEQQEVSYPEVLQCVFSGARGLFMDCLIRNTSALIVVGSPGFLLISGLAEPVVRAYSLITDLVERFQVFQSRPTEPGDRGGPGESLESRRAFKALVEKWEDRHTLDLLVLPAPLKEILLDLVRESGPESTGRSLTGGATAAGSHLDEDRTLPSTDRKADGILAADNFQASLTQERAEEAEEGAALPPSLLVQRAAAGSTREERLNGDEDPELPTRIKEFRLLLRFFTAMGYTENVVKRVLARTGLKEASEILDLVQQEQDRSEQEPPRERNRPCETEHREDNLVKRNGETPEEEEEEEEEEGELMQVEASPESKEQEEDFVLGVLKKAAASCGYAEQNVAKVYNALPNRSTHQLLLELQRETGAVREGPREMDDVMPENDRRNKEVEARGENDLFLPAERTKPKENGLEKMPSLIAPAPRADLFTWNRDVQKLPSKTETPPQVTLSDVKGPPTPFYASSVDSQLKVFQSDKQLSRSPDRAVSTAAQQSHQSYSSTSKSPSANSSMRQPPMFKDPSPTRGRDSRGFAAASSVVVTGEQRFLEGLQTPFELKLTDRPADPKLRSIVIDGSNVAMSHGLGQFFSCRGIALAVQHFWDRGHRNISALLPQWRQKSDPRIKEQHYLTALQSLGLLSFTPSREVQGKRIASYDDRLILQLAQKTDGVIVTNDNLRDLSDESPAWTNIIKKRLLQYTFVGDHFMVPDDPLGRGGPHLDDFLRSDHRTPDPGNNSFAVNFRDQAFGGGPEAGGRGRGGGGRGHYGNATRHHGGQQWAGLRAVGGDRTPEETCGLREQLCQVFPGQENMVTLVLDCHLAEKDVNVLSDLILEQWM